MNNMSTTLGLSKDPAKYEQRALAYEQKGNMAKATKNREKALRLRQQQASGQTSTYSNPLKNPERYDQKAIKWQNKGNMQKAEKNRQKAARLRAEQATRGNNLGAPLVAGNTGYPAGANTFSTGGANTFPAGGNTFSGANTMNTGLATQTVVAPPIVEQVTRPTVFQQTTRPEKIVEIQPVVHREIDQPQVHVVERHSYEAVPSTGPSVINRQPIVQETVRPRVIEEVQPVVHREVPAPFVERVEQHVTERVVQPTVVTKEVLNNVPAATPGVAAGGLPPSSNSNLPASQQSRRL